MYLLDTDILIDFFRSRQHRRTFFHYLLQSQEKLAISVVTLTELYAGKSTTDQDKMAEIDGLKSEAGLCFFSLTPKIAKLAGVIIRDSNYNTSFTDATIAATAIYKQIPLITSNTKHFEKIAKLVLHTPGDWNPRQ